ncbi:AraC family transcriptional regulator [Streptomyces niveus]|uniref:helix-turn-helix transcriptional regulator n=1 Tax=Streptomyces niveus TaxID=193462 RepID=UPI00362CF321
MLWETATNGVARIGPEAEEDTYLCGGYFWFDEPNASMLIDILPRLVHVRAADPRSRQLAQVTELLSSEVENNAVGRSLVLDHLAQILFVHVLRAHAEQTDRPTGWLGTLNDDGIGAALRALHADVAHRWTLQELADISRMSRSAFAASFKKQVGTAPLEYLIQWRMSLARDALRRNTRSISELASATGYESESAFSTAFRRVTGSSPRQFRDTAHHAVGLPRHLPHRDHRGPPRVHLPPPSPTPGRGVPHPHPHPRRMGRLPRPLRTPQNPSAPAPAPTEPPASTNTPASDGHSFDPSRPVPSQRGRLVEIRDNLLDRITEVAREGWLGEIEGLQVSLTGAEGKLAQLDAEQQRNQQAVHLGMPTFEQTMGRST